MSMIKIEISDLDREEDGVNYVTQTLGALAFDLGGEMQTFKDTSRVGAIVTCPEKYSDLLRSEIENKVADVLAIRHKYSFLKRRFHPAGLSDYQAEILYTAIISADIEDDKRYILRRVRGLENYFIDGVYNFKLKALKNKWKEILAYIPLFFTQNQLFEFVAYLVGEKKGKRVIVKDGNVFDLNYNLLKKSALLGRGEDVVKEVLLSASGNVQVFSGLTAEQEKYLKGFFGGRIAFLKGSLQKTVDKKI